MAEKIDRIRLWDKDVQKFDLPKGAILLDIETLPFTGCDHDYAVLTVLLDEEQAEIETRHIRIFKLNKDIYREKNLLYIGRFKLSGTTHYVFEEKEQI